MTPGLGPIMFPGKMRCQEGNMGIARYCAAALAASLAAGQPITPVVSQFEISADAFLYGPRFGAGASTSIASTISDQSMTV